MENMNDKIMTEAFYGKTPILQEAENTLETLMTEIKIRPLRDYTNHPLTKRFCKLLCQQFGFRKVFLVWKRTARLAANAGTMMSVDIISDSFDSFDKAIDGVGIYDHSHRHVVYISCSATMIVQCGLTAEEIMGILIHEIGHNFDKSPYAMIRVGYAFITEIYQALNDQNSTYVRLAHAGNAFGMTNMGKGVNGTVTSTKEYAKDVFPIFKVISMKFKQLMDWFMRGFEIVFSPAVFLSTPLFILCSPICHFSTLFGKKMEEFADSFATAYGYGAAMSSGLVKIESSNIILADDRPYLINGIRKTLGDIAMAERYMLSLTLGSDHGTNDTRMMTMIQMLRKDVTNEEYPLEVRTEIQNQIDKLEIVYNRYMSLEPMRGQGVITHALRNFFSKVFRGRSDYIAKLFPENNVNRYESTEEEERYYDVYSILEEKVDDGEITLEQMYEVNDIAFEKYIIESARHKMKRYNTLNDVLSKSKENSNVIENDNIMVIFSDNTLEDGDHAEIKKLYDRVLSNKDKIIDCITKKAIVKKAINNKDTKQVLDCIEFYIGTDDKLDVAAYVSNAGQYYMPDIRSKGISMNNAIYQD